MCRVTGPHCTVWASLSHQIAFFVHQVVYSQWLQTWVLKAVLLENRKKREERKHLEGIVISTFNPSTWESEAGELQWVQGQPWICSKTSSHKYCFSNRLVKCISPLPKIPVLPESVSGWRPEVNSRCPPLCSAFHFLKDLFVFICGCFVCTLCVCNAYKDQKRVSSGAVIQKIVIWKWCWEPASSAGSGSAVSCWVSLVSLLYFWKLGACCSACL